MATARPFVLLGRTQRALAEARVARVAESWLREWQAGKAALTVRCELPEGCAHDRPGATWQMVRSDAAYWIAASIAANTVRALGTVYSGMDASHGSASKEPPPLLAALASRSVEELCASLLADVGAVGASRAEPAAVGEATWRRGSGALLFELALDAVRLPVLASPSVVTALVGAAGRAPCGVLAQRREALCRERVLVCAYAGEAELAIGDLATLATGDVIRLNTRLGERFQVALGNGAPMASGALGTFQGHKAIQITA